MGLLGKIFGSAGNGASKLIDSVGSVIDNVVTTDKERKQLKNEMAQQIRNFELEQMKAELKDRNSARDMYEADSWLQKIYALVFLGAYILLTTIVLYGFYLFISQGDLEVPQWGVSFISMIWGGITSKLNTITDFLFGSSQGSKQKNKALSELKGADQITKKQTNADTEQKTNSGKG